MDSRPIVVLAHVLAAFWWFAGYAGTNICTEIARRSTTDDDCRSAIVVSGRLDRLANRTGGTAVGLTGLLLVIVTGRAWTTPWILVSIVLFATVVFGGIFLWERFGGGVEAAAAANDWPGVRRALNAPRVIAYGRLENVAVLAIIVLMVLGPG
ncbi:MAG TPA: DUF2269 family protein [Candidatus Limnocylindrales bacterium]|nr:DUF2269 family protein [Candidatus Limnocylindrales bacterium]